MFYLQVSDLEACGKAPPSKFSDVIVAQVQSFYRNQLYSLTAIYSADLIMMPREQKETRHVMCVILIKDLQPLPSDWMTKEM